MGAFGAAVWGSFKFLDNELLEACCVVGVFVSLCTSWVLIGGFRFFFGTIIMIAPLWIVIVGDVNEGWTRV